MKEIFLPVVRFAGHATAASFGFAILFVVTLVPIFLLKLAAWAGLSELTTLIDWRLLEKAILYLDLGLYGAVLVVSAVVFVVEEIGAVRRALRRFQSDVDDV